MRFGMQMVALELAEAIRDQDWRHVADILADILNEDERYDDEPKDPELDS